MTFIGNKILSTFLILGAAISINVLAFGDQKCKGMAITMTETQINNIKFCAGKMGVTKPEEMTKEKMPCFSKCIMEKKGLVDEAGKPHKENINDLIDSTMPESVRGDIKAAFGTCLDEHGSKVDPKDASCATYAPLTMCTMQAVMKICM